MPKERRAQHKLDYERLFTVCRLREVLMASAQSPVNYQHLLMEAQSTGFTAQRTYVDEHVRAQLVATARAIHGALLQAGDPAIAAARLSDAGPPSSSSSSDGTSTSEPSSRLVRTTLSALVRPHLGFSLSVGPSSIKHPAAGDGVFLQGEASPGTVLAFVPGLSYSRTQYARMPNFPRIDTGNPYLSRRYDMDIIDSKPWGLGDERLDGGPWPTRTCPEASMLLALEGRHPLALGHMVNHPAPGMQPNVMEVSMDWELRKGEEAWLRAYFPNCPWLEAEEDEQEEGASEEQMEGLAEHLRPGGKAASARTLALVATRSVRDGEELLQNYRLNPSGPQPAWYTSVDPEEDARRWARLPLMNIMAPPREAAK